MVFFLLVASVKSTLTRLALFVLCVATLWLHGARSEFAAVFFVMAVLEFVHSRRRGLVTVVTLFVGTTLFIGLDAIIAGLPENRMVQLFDLSENTSWQSRNVLLEQALKTIAESPILGDYGSYAVEGGAGDYAHNILSAWVDLGLPGFVYLCLILVIPSFALGTLAFGQHRESQYLIALALTLSSFLLLIVAKDFTYLPIAAALGAYARFASSPAGQRLQPRLLENQ
jgi:hypothetical protein